MSSAVIVILKDVFMQDIIQMLFIENDHVIQAFSAKCANDTFGDWILPWTSRGSRRVFQAELFSLLLEVFTKDFVVISK